MCYPGVTHLTNNPLSLFRLLLLVLYLLLSSSSPSLHLFSLEWERSMDRPGKFVGNSTTQNLWSRIFLVIPWTTFTSKDEGWGFLRLNERGGWWVLRLSFLPVPFLPPDRGRQHFFVLRFFPHLGTNSFPLLKTVTCSVGRVFPGVDETVYRSDIV